MSIVKADISMSLDGFIAGPGDGVDNPLGDRGDLLHEWIYGLRGWRERHGYEGGESTADDEVLEEAFAGVRAVVIGRRMFAAGEGPWGADPPFRVPVFVVQHRQREALVKGETTFVFVGGVERAVEEAREAAGDGDVSIGGGANVIQQALRAGLLDELQVHVVPVLLGGGVRLFEGLDPADVTIEPLRLLASRDVTHMKLRVR
jgi:dihydrofolate reductase